MDVAASEAPAGPVCRFCRRSYRRRSPGQKYCDRCRQRRGGKKKDDAATPSAASSLTFFLVQTATFGILTISGDRVPVTIPANAFLSVVGRATSDGALLDVLWDEKRLIVFNADLLSRCKPVPSIGSMDGQPRAHAAAV